MGTQGTEANTPSTLESEDSHGSKRALGFLGLGCYMDFRDRARRAKTQSDPKRVPTIGLSVSPYSKAVYLGL